MPIKGKSSKQIMKTEMHKFKQGTLHSGSSTGPIVTNRKQAIAIGMSEAGTSKPQHFARKKKLFGQA